MAVQWDNPQAVEAFKADALKSGFSPDEVESFVSKNAPKVAPLQLTDTGEVSLPSQTPEVSLATPMPQEEVVPQAPTPLTTVEPFATPEPFTIPQLPAKQESVATPQPAMTQPTPSPTPVVQEMAQPTPAPTKKIVTQPFMNRSSVEKYSGGRNLGTDYRAKPGTQLNAPEGEWEVVRAKPGWNGGSGNFVEIKNTQTGETLGFEHMSKIHVKPGQAISGGTPLGASGGVPGTPGAGNTTGAHISIPYKDAQGNYRDVNRSKYINQIF